MCLGAQVTGQTSPESSPKQTSRPTAGLSEPGSRTSLQNLKLSPSLPSLSTSTMGKQTQRRSYCLCSFTTCFRKANPRNIHQTKRCYISGREAKLDLRNELAPQVELVSVCLPGVSGTSSDSGVNTSQSQPSGPNPAPALTQNRKGTFTDDLHQLVDNWARDAISLSHVKKGPKGTSQGPGHDVRPHDSV